MNDKILFVCMAALLPSLAFGQGSDKYQCTYGDLTRRVEILYDAAERVPCEVHYYKDTEMPGWKQVLWSASADAGYCETKTREFIAKLNDWGWECTHADDASGEPDEMEPVDDTAVLAPADEMEAVDDTAELAPADVIETTDNQ